MVYCQHLYNGTSIRTEFLYHRKLSEKMIARMRNVANIFLDCRKCIEQEHERAALYT